MRIPRIISARSPWHRGLGTAGRRGVLLAGMGLLAACGYFGGGSHAAAVARATSKSHPAPPPDPAAQALAAMVDAVGPSRSQPPVNLKFSIRKRPEVGQDDQIDFAVVPQVAGLQSVKVAFGSLSGLTVVSHAPPLTAVKPASGVPIFGSVTVRPDSAGLFTLTAAVAVQSPDRTVMWPFSIPVIAGDGPPQTAVEQR
jgi:hypothetical protein